VALIALTGWGIYLLRQRKRKLIPEPVPEEPVVEKDPLAAAEDMLGNSNLQGFYLELTVVLWNKVADAYGVLYSELNKQTVAAQLHKQGWEDAGIHQFLDIITECEMNLYMPEYRAGLSPEELLYKTKRLLLLFRS
jgi:hypothetical protein